MKKNSTSQSAFFNRRILIGFVCCLVGISVALAGFGQYRSANMVVTDCRYSVGITVTGSPDATPTHL